MGTAPRSAAPFGREAAGFPGWDGDRAAAFRRALLDFYRASARDLPWRGSPRPYDVLVSEFMLQQTRVEAAIPYFEAWMRRFPDLSALAGADSEEVLRVWAGLGYYARARNLHRAVREVVAQRGGEIPDQVEELRALPGVGEYTAAAVASIAFGVRAATVDGNVRRVLARLADEADPSPANLRHWASQLLDPEDPGAFNQAMMELGALVCTPRAPGCGRCPVATYCRARAAGTQEERPARRAPRVIPRSREAVAAVVGESDGRFFLLFRKRPEKGLLGGLWELPGAEVGENEGPHDSAKRLADSMVRSFVGTGRRDSVGAGTRLEPLEHVFTHRRLCYLPYLFRVAVKRIPRGASHSLRWVEPDCARELALPAAQRTLLTRVEEALGVRAISTCEAE